MSSFLNPCNIGDYLRALFENYISMEIKLLILRYQRLSEEHVVGPIFVIGLYLRGISTVYNSANLFAEHELLINSLLDQTEPTAAYIKQWANAK